MFYWGHGWCCVAVDTTLKLKFHRSPCWPKQIPKRCQLAQPSWSDSRGGPLGPSSTESFGGVPWFCLGLAVSLCCPLLQRFVASSHQGWAGTVWRGGLLLSDASRNVFSGHLCCRCCHPEDRRSSTGGAHFVCGCCSNVGPRRRRLYTQFERWWCALAGERRQLCRRAFTMARSLSSVSMAVAACECTSKRRVNGGRPSLTVCASDGWSVLVTEVSRGTWRMSSRMRAHEISPIIRCGKSCAAHDSTHTYPSVEHSGWRSQNPSQREKRRGTCSQRCATLWWCCPAQMDAPAP